MPLETFNGIFHVFQQYIMRFQQHVFTEREVEIAGFLARGRSINDICKHLGLSRKIVKAHIGNMIEKTGASDVGKLRSVLISNLRQ